MGIANMEDSPWKAWKMNTRINPRPNDEMVRNGWNKNGCLKWTQVITFFMQ